MYWNFDKNFCDCILAAAKIFYERTKKCTIFLLYSSKAKITIKALAKIWYNKKIYKIVFKFAKHFYALLSENLLSQNQFLLEYHMVGHNFA